MFFFITNDFSNFLVLFCFVILLNVGCQKSCAYVFTYTITDSNCIVDCYVLLFPDFINKKCLTLILKTFNSTGKFCYQHGDFQDTESATGGLLKIQIKVSQNSQENNYASVSFLIKLQGLGLHLH